MSRAGRPQRRGNLDTILLPLHQIGDSKMQEMKTRRKMDLQLGKVAIFRASNVKPCLEAEWKLQDHREESRTSGSEEI